MTSDPRPEMADAIEAAAWEALFEAIPAPMRSATGARVDRAGGATLLVAPGIPTPYFNRAIGLGGGAPARPEDVRAIADAFVRAGSTKWMVHASAATRATGDLRAWLREAGLVLLPSRPTWAKFLRDATPVPEVDSRLAVGPATAAEADVLAAVLVAAHGLPPRMAQWTAALVRHPELSMYCLRDGRDIVGGALLFQRGERAWLGLAGTTASHRGQGGQKLLMARRIMDAIGRGASVLATETGEPIADEPNPSFHNMLWAGFTKVCSRENWVVP